MLIREEEQKQKQVQSLIKGWLTSLEKAPAWDNVDPEIVSQIRLAVIRTAWGAYKIGLFSRKDDLVTAEDN